MENPLLVPDTRPVVAPASDEQRAFDQLGFARAIDLRQEEWKREPVPVQDSSPPPQAPPANSTPRPFECVPVTLVGGFNGIRVYPSIVQGEVPDGMDPIEGQLIGGLGSSGVIYVKVTRDSTTGSITARAIEQGSSVPPNTATDSHALLANYTVDSGSVTVVNVGYGPIGAFFCGEFVSWSYSN